MEIKTRYARFFIPLFLLLIAGISFGQEQDIEVYPVKLVTPDQLIRPPTTFEPNEFSMNITGRFPTLDGEEFHINLYNQKSAGVRDLEARDIVKMFLMSIEWRHGDNALVDSKPLTRPKSQKENLEPLIKESLDKTRQELIRKYGKVSEADEKLLMEQENMLRRQADTEFKTFRYNQNYKGLPIENSNIRLTWADDIGFVSLSGQLFNFVKMANRQSISPEQAVRKATEYLKEYTTLVDEMRTKPVKAILPYGEAFRYTWKFTLTADEGPYQFWIDAQSGEVLQIVPMFASTGGKGLVFRPDPLGATEEMSFEVNAPSGGNYSLFLTGFLRVSTNGADGGSSTDLTIASGTSGTADFNVSPINVTAVERTSDTNYNSRFQEVNAYAWLYNNIYLMNNLFGSVTLPYISATVNHSNPCGFGIHNACANWGTWTLQFGIGNATTSASTNCNNTFNSALDATVLIHELGHLVSHRNNTGTIPTHVDEGFSDFWANTILDTDTFGRYWGQNCATHDQGGWMPRRVEALDVFPEHRALSTNAYGDAQMMGWALWNIRRELNEISALGTLIMNTNLLDAVANASFGNTGTVKQIHDNYQEVEEELADLFKTSSSVHKVISGFARAGIFLAEKDAVIDINDDYLNRNDVGGPTFTIWTGRDYTFNAAGNVNTTTQPFNTRFEVEVANDAAFSVNLVSSGTLAGVTASDGGKASWALPAADWTTLRAQDYLYYRVTTTNATGGNVRQSWNPGNSFFTAVPNAYAVINESGDCECTCGTSAATSSGAMLVTILPLLFGIVLMVRLKRRKN